MNAAYNRTQWVLALLALGTTLSAAEPSRLLEVRLLSPISTTDARTWNTPVCAEIVRWITDGPVTTPSRTLLWGNVRKAQPVGFGLVRERAALTIEFTQEQTESGERVPINALLVSIDNAREQVDKNGRIRGILAANNPLGIVRGIWYRPHPAMFLRAAGGVPGASGTLWVQTALGPAGAAGMFVAKLLLTRLPDPEILLLPGAEMTLRVDGDMVAQPEEQIQSLADESLGDALGAYPSVIQKPNGMAVPDIMNVALEGSEDLVRQTFLSAGWSEAEPLNRRSFGRAYKAFTQRSGYAAAPVSTLLYQGRPPDLVFQKSLNSIAKRHHVRLWRVEQDGVEVWLGAASHDVTVTLDSRKLTLSHRIDPSLDVERQKVLGDLAFAGAIEELSLVNRTVNTSTAGRTDGRLAVAKLRASNMQPSIDYATPNTKIPRAKRLVRRATLEARQYLLRENVYYLGYLLVRKAVGHGHAAQTTEQAAKPDNEPKGLF